MKQIDADSLLRWVKNSKQDNPCLSLQGKAIWGFVHDHLSRMISDAPVARGEWVHGCRNGMGTEYCYCSECSEDALKDASGFVEFSNFCPNCGARMSREGGTAEKEESE